MNLGKLKTLIKSHQQKLIIIIGYIIVALLGIGLGRLMTQQPVVPEIRVEEVFSPPNYSASTSGVQSGTIPKIQLDCVGKIKGSSSMIYHLPGGAFYNRTTSPIRCFDNEADASAAGFRKSSR